MIQKHRILTEIGKDKKIALDLKQNFDLLEILSLKFTQQDAYTSICADYGVVCGRISVNNGLGVPNARVSIFIPQTDIDANDPVISALYPYKTLTDTDDAGYQYNLLPARKQHGGHEPTGTFPDQSQILAREEYLEVFEKYYKFTVKTNTSGDFMIWGVPLGEQIIHVDVDLSDIGCFSLRPDDFIRQGKGVDSFKNKYAYKASIDYASLPQIVSFNRTIDVAPFWGSVDLCQIGITRTDFDLSDQGVRIEPKAYFLGSIFTDQGKNSVNKNCTPRGEMGEKCSLISEPATVEIIRFSNAKDSNDRPILEEYEIHEDIEEDGAFVLPLPMNMEYVYTNQFGENEITNDPNKGVPTSACYRFRVSAKHTDLGRVRAVGSYLVPNIREYSTNEDEVDKSYPWSLQWEDYPTAALSDTVIFNNTYGSYYPQDYFYRFNYNKVYGVSSFLGSYFSGNGFSRDTYLGIKEIVPKDEDDCQNNVVTPPTNWAIKNFNFAILLAIIINFFERIIYTAYVAAIQVLILPFQWIMEKCAIHIDLGFLGSLDWEPFAFFDGAVIEPLQRFGTVRLGIAIYPECETCDNLDYTTTPPIVTADPSTLYVSVGSGVAQSDDAVWYCLGNAESNNIRLYFSTPTSGTWAGSCGGYGNSASYSGSATLVSIVSSTSGRYQVKFSNGKYGGLTLSELTYYDISGYTQTLFIFDDSQKLSWDSQLPPSGGVSYTIYDTTQYATGNSGSSGLNTELEGGCQQYVTAYRENIIAKTYCVTDPTRAYSTLTSGDLVNGTTCPSGKVAVGQVIYKTNNNPCGSCDTKSGYSEFRYGLFTIIPGAGTPNWGYNFDAITEYANRKLVAKLFCEGVSNYSFIDNWLTGSLYLFPFKAKVRWDDEAALDLNYRRTSYCDDLVYFKVGTLEKPVKRFYYRSTPFNGSSFSTSIKHPTTVVDLGPRDEFIKEICIDPALDPNCSVVRNIGPTSYQSFKEMLGLYINYKMDTGNATISILNPVKTFFSNTGFDSRLPSKMDSLIMNGDVLQLISINNEAGIQEFDLQNQHYSAYNPQLLDPDNYQSLFKTGGDWGPLPINLILDDGDGYRVRQCLNEPGNLTEASQVVPFYLWDKKGTGFGSGVSQSWDYTSVQSQPLQGMKNLSPYQYNFTGDSTFEYILFPMTKDYGGNVIGLTGIGNSLIDIFDIVYSADTHTNFNIQEEGFTFLYTENNLTGTLWTRTGSTGNWASQAWASTDDFYIKPTATNYAGNKQILSTPFLFYFGLRPGKTAVDKFIERFGPKGAFPSAE